jgi:glycosyltransferase involved in cell wall biosynthesis
VSSAVLVVPGSLDGRTGGYAYDRAIAAGLRARGWSIDVRELDGSFPRPSPGALDRAAQAFDAIPARTIVLVDGLAFGAMPDIIVAHASRLSIVALVHLPLAADVGLEPGESARLEEAERRALEAAARIVVTGKGALPLLERYRLEPGRVAVVEPGTARAPLARGSSGLPLQLLAVATLNPGKGHEDLLTALASVPRRQWRLTCAGSLTRHPATVERVRAAIDRLALADRVVLAGELDGSALEACYDTADLFVLATRQETYGMAVAEALAHGLPVVSTMTGAIPALGGEAAGLLVAPGDTVALSDALSRVLCDDELRASLARGARQRRTMLRGWEEATAEMAAVLAEAPKGRRRAHD